MLVDVEKGDHPWLAPFGRLLEAWRSQGVRVYRLDFSMRSSLLVDPDVRDTHEIEALARRTEGLPMLVFSRQLTASAREGEARWLSSMGHCPVKAWVDPDPRPLLERKRVRRRDIDRLVSIGLQRFPLTDAGIVSMSRWFAADGEGSAGVSWGAIAPRPGGEGDPVEESLRKWAFACAVVPDATWDQAEAIRQHFPEIHTVLTQPRDFERLREWVAREVAPAEPEFRGGQALYIPEEVQDLWIRQHRHIEAEHLECRGFERRARELLLAQLSSAKPKEALQPRPAVPVAVRSE